MSADRLGGSPAAVLLSAMGAESGDENNKRAPQATAVDYCSLPWPLGDRTEKPQVVLAQGQ